MIKTLPLVAVVLFFASCNHTPEPRPDADRVIKDTLAQLLPEPFNQNPPQQNIYARVETRQENVLCARDASIKRIMESLKSAPQKFVIDNKQATEITGSLGTRLSFMPNSFVGSDGNEVNDPVTIELKECYKPDAMLCENLLTATDGNFSASKGMIFINAYAGGKALQLKEGEKVHVQFPFEAEGHNGYLLYHGDENADGLIVWNAVCESNTAGPRICASSDFAKPEFSYLGLGLKEYLLQNLNYPDEARRNELSAHVEVTFMVTTDGKVKDVITAESYKIFRQVIEQSLVSMPLWKPAVYKGKNIASSVHLNIDFNIRRADQVQVDFNDSKSSLISAGNDVYVLYGTDLKGEPQGMSARALGRMGWFNYGKHLHKEGQTAEVIVCSNEKSEVKLLMKNGSTIIGGENCVGFTDFQNLPMGETAYIVAVRYDQGNMLYAVQPVKLTKQSVVSLKWKKGDKAEIAKTYKRLSQEI